MISPRRSVLIGALFVLPLIATRALAEAPAPPDVKQSGLAPEFMRLVDDGPSGGKLETADVTYRHEDGTSVTLVSAVHIGEKSYFQGLNESFKKYDAVLFELVKPKDGPVPGGAPGAVPENRQKSAMGEMQRTIKDVLNLSFQLDEVDYTAKNFVHADLDAETFEKMQVEKGQTFPELMLKGLMKAMNDPQAASKDLPLANAEDPDEQMRTMIRTFTRPDSERQIKMMVARQMTSVEQDNAFLGGDDSVILADRNTAAMKVLEQTLKDGKAKQIAIYYGAAHMPDMEKRLTGLGFKKTATEWRTAWDLRIRADEPSAVEKLLLDALGEAAGDPSK
jgi:hypothetical protein